MLDLGLQRGFNFGAHFIEVYGGDCDDPVLAPVLTVWGALLTSYLGNISSRGFVQTGNDVMIGGFIVQGTGPKRVIVRAIGPELTPFGIPNALADPTLELHNGTGALIASNDNWQTTIIGGIITGNQVSAIQNSGHAPTQPSESAIIATLPPGNYTAIVRGVNNTTGVALVEVYDLSPNTTSVLGNISTRGFVQTGDNVMIGGFIVQGTEPKRVIVRAIGPELTPFGIPNALADPTLELHNGTGALIASNDNWQTTHNRRDYHRRPGQRDPEQRACSDSAQASLRSLQRCHREITPRSCAAGTTPSELLSWKCTICNNIAF